MRARLLLSSLLLVLAGCGSDPVSVAASLAPTPSAGLSSPVAVPSSAPSPSPSRSAAGSPTAKPKPGTRTMTFVNKLSETVWLAANRNKEHPLAATGWVLRPGASVTVSVPDKWGGRFWGRTGCSFDASGRGHCETGDCGGRFQCDGGGATPATLAEFALAAWGGMDFYDVSMVDGSNLPVWINVSHATGKDPVSAGGCVAAGCSRAVDCPAGMRVAAGGRTVACRTACAAFGGDAYCCRGSWSGREHCVPSKWPTDYTQVFKHAAPYAYSYAYDDSATMACKGGCSYRITFGVSG
ncbi:thaumatin family protein [Hamadaea tsunoensis]|uniref:thaumatin family protein n=1 Tax=Hamadaea tsunoensis TaxID=53368 RepID=UPI0004133129|nr:thaumatin family protein [Hamadaea tsunoensis]